MVKREQTSNLTVDSVCIWKAMDVRNVKATRKLGRTAAVERFAWT